MKREDPGRKRKQGPNSKGGREKTKSEERLSILSRRLEDALDRRYLGREGLGQLAEDIGMLNDAIARGETLQGEQLGDFRAELDDLMSEAGGVDHVFRTRQR